jgi:hypothetical protein
MAELRGGNSYRGARSIIPSETPYGLASEKSSPLRKIPVSVLQIGCAGRRIRIIVSKRPWWAYPTLPLSKNTPACQPWIEGAGDALIAQLDGASDFDSEGWGFEPS